MAIFVKEQVIYSDEIVKDACLRAFRKREKLYEIDVFVPLEHRCKGIATGLLKQITDDADKEGVTLYAIPMPPLPKDNGDRKKYEEDKKRHEEDKKKLIKLYKKFGFEFERSIGGEEMSKMIRKPLSQ